MLNNYEQVKNNFLAGRIDQCACYFEQNNHLLEAGYCYIVEGEFKKAETIFLQIQEQNHRAHWGLFLLEILTDNVKKYPTYFEIRNFLEIDMNIFIKYYKGDYIEKIVRYSDYMQYFNPETFKYIGRVFWANNLIPAAMFFLRKAKDKFYNDPELHYLLAYIYFNDNNIEECKKSLNSCLDILPEYAPALKLKEQLK